MDLYEASTKFVSWLERRIIAAGRGDGLQTLDVEPAGRFWLGRLTSESAVAATGLGARGERLEPCAMGLRVLPAGGENWVFAIDVSACAWLRGEGGRWTKRPISTVVLPVAIPNASPNEYRFGQAEIAHALEVACGAPGLSGEIRIDVAITRERGPEFSITMVNTSPEVHEDFKDTNLYECCFSVRGLFNRSYMLEALPDSFRYDRRVAAYGINGGYNVNGQGNLTTTDTISVDQGRASFWNVDESAPDLRFVALASDPVPGCRQLASALSKWGADTWGPEALAERSARNSWTAAMRPHFMAS